MFDMFRLRQFYYVGEAELWPPPGGGGFTQFRVASRFYSEGHSRVVVVAVRQMVPSQYILCITWQLASTDSRTPLAQVLF